MKKTNLLFSALLVMIIMLSFSKAQAQDPFITKWTTSNPGYSDTSSIIIPTTGTGYNYDVSWNNDGVWETGFTGDATHDYGVAGTYTVAIRGTFPRIFFNYDFDVQKIISIEQWGDIAWTSMENAFLGCLNLIYNATDAPDLSGVTSLSSMFAFATNLNANLNNWDVSNITDMTSMFLDANNFNGNISTWNVNNVTNMTAMFINCYLFNQDISNWNVSKVTNMAGMFLGAASFNQNIGSWDVSKVMDMYAMFSSAVSFNQNIGSWDVGNVLYMDAMFEYASSFNQNIGNWDVSDVTNMESMFDYATSFNQNIGNWNVGNVWNMNNMFQSASAFNQNIGTWSLGNVESMFHMFYEADVFNQDLNLWDVSNVSDMTGMFAYTGAFNGNISNWNLSSAKYLTEMFSYAAAFNGNISSWDVSNVEDMYAMFLEAPSFDQNLGSWSLNSIFYLDEMLDAPAGQGMGCDNVGKTLLGWASNVNTPDNLILGIDNRGVSLTATTAMALLTAKGWTFDGSTSPCTPLSMDLIDFQAKPNQKERSVELSWVTARENNNARFELLRSANGTDWNIIGSVKGNGTVDSKSEYHYTDNQPETKNYYRLNQIDFDGKESASEIRFVAFTNSNTAAIAIYPNPTNGVFTIASEAGQSYSITDLYGRVIAQGVLSTNQTSIDLTGNSNGLYVVKVGEAVEKILLK